MVRLVLARKLLRDLRQRKGSLFTLVLIVAIGVGSYVGMAAVWRDMDGARERYYNDCRLADFSVNLKRAPEWAVAQVASLPNVREARGRVVLAVLIDLPHVDEPVSGTAISMPEERTPVLNDVSIQKGLWFSGRDEKEVILNDSFARANDLKPGDRIKVLLLDEQHDLLVVGTAMSPEFVYLIPEGGGLAPDPAKFGVLYLTEDFLRKTCDLEGAYNEIVGKVHNASPTVLRNTLSLIEDRLDAFGVTSTTPASEQASVKFLSDELAGLKVSSAIMPGIFLGVAALVLNVLMGRMVAQQRTVIGTLKALGYSTGAVTRHYLGHGAIVGSLGGIAGCLFGYWVQTSMVSVYRQFYALPRFEAQFHPDLFLRGFCISLFFACLGTIKGLRYAAKLEPAEAMRPPPPEKGGRVFPERIPFFWNRLPFRWKMILRTVFRNPFRSAVSVLASAIATALVFTALANVDALNYMMAYEFTMVSHQDVTVSLRDPKGRRAPSELQSFETISATEPELAVVCDFKNGPYEKRTGITGIAPGNRLYTPLDSEGNPIVVPDSGLVLSKKLGEILNVKPGDILRMRPLIARRQEVRAPVVGLVETFLGLSAYADLEYLSRLLGEDWCANVLLGDFYPGSDKSRFLKELKKRPSVTGIGERRRSLDQLEETFGKTMGAMISIMVFFAGLIAFGSVLNAALVSLSERQREVGTLRVLGYTPGQVSRVFSGESLLLNSVGIAGGLMAGIGLSHLVSKAYSTELYRFPVVVYPSRLVITSILMMLIVGLAQIILFRMIRSLEWLEVLKVKE